MILTGDPSDFDDEPAIFRGSWATSQNKWNRPAVSHAVVTPCSQMSDHIFRPIQMYDALELPCPLPLSDDNRSLAIRRSGRFGTMAVLQNQPTTDAKTLGR
jgi:hypothetical protein